MGRTVNKESQLTTKEKLKLRKKESKQKLKDKRARLVIKNLPFRINEEKLKEYFGQFGEVKSVELLKNEDGKLKGVGFVQFSLVQKAAKARYHTNGKPFMERELSVDFALPKNKYEKVKKEVKPKVESNLKSDESIDELKNVTNNLNEGETDKKLDETLKEDSGSGSDSGSDSDSDGDRDGDVNGDSEDKPQIEENKKPRVISNDVAEGKTIFIKNIPFTATNEDLKSVMGQFGPIYYALICMDKLTEHSKGTGFVKFKEKEDAEKALKAGTELKLMGQVLDCHPALPRNDVMEKSEKKKELPRDSRNLYLVKEGVILANSKAAVGVSASDMAKRLQLEQYKTQMLRNLNMFISRERLIVHNLPPSWDDKKLKTLFQKFSPKGAVIKEARIMRNLRDVDDKGVGRSKEYGFVAFTKHEDALFALRSLNNNPTIFTPNKRPIVAFSIENKAMIKAKQKRLEKSRQKNPKSKSYKPETTNNNHQDESNIEKDFAGIAAKPGPLKLRNKFNLKKQAMIHHENLKMAKNKKKSAKKTLDEKRKEFTKQPKQKINKRKREDDNFSKLVADYKKKLTSVPEGKKSKWYE